MCRRGLRHVHRKSLCFGRERCQLAHRTSAYVLLRLQVCDITCGSSCHPLSLRSIAPSIASYIPSISVRITPCNTVRSAFCNSLLPDCSVNCTLWTRHAHALNPISQSLQTKLSLTNVWPCQIMSITEDAAIRIDFNTLQSWYGFTHMM